MAENLAGMIGKSFEYEERTQVKILQEILTGTVSAFVGGANWGPLNKPTLVNQDFEVIFGNPLLKIDNADTSGQAASYTLNYVPYCWFTRISDGSDTKAVHNIFKSAVPASIEGIKAIRDTTFVIYDAQEIVYNQVKNQNNQLNFSVLSDASVTPVDIPVVLDATPSCAPIVSVNILPDIQEDDSLIRANGNLVATTPINLNIDDVDYRYLVKNEFVTGNRNPNTPDFMNLVVPASGPYDASYGPVAVAASFGPAAFNLPDTPAEVAEYTGVPAGCLTSVTISCDEGGIIGNGSITGNGTDDLATLVTAFEGTQGTLYTIVGDDAQIPDLGEIIILAGGLNAILNSSVATTIICDTPGIAGNIPNITGNGTSTLAVLVGAGYTITPAGAELQILKSGEIISISGGSANGTGNWVSYVPDAAVNTYSKRFAYALKKYVIVPKLEGLGLNNADAISLANILVVADNTSITLSSVQAGSVSKIKVYSVPKIFAATPVSPLTSNGADTSTLSILSQINAALNLAAPGVATVTLNTLNNRFKFITNVGGDAFGVKINATTIPTANIYSTLGITPGLMVMGQNSVVDAGTFEAVHSGSAGNSIEITKIVRADGKALSISFQGYTIGSFFNYSYDTTASNFIGKLMDKDVQVSAVVKLFPPAGLTVMPELAYGSFKLGGGNSGVSGLTSSNYNEALDVYRNVDLYDFDLLCVSGITSEDVQNLIEDICEYRRDCFAVLDPPETAAGTTAVGGSPSAMIDWHNGEGGQGRTKKMESKFTATYFPYISIPDGTVDAKSTYYAPSVRVIGAICNSDKILGNKFGAPAGNISASITSVNSLAQYVREDEKNRMYADELDNNINPIVYTGSRGFFIDGQKDCLRGAGAISRLNVLRTSLYIKKRIYEITPNYFWKPLTKRTMDDFAYDLKTIGEYLSSPEVNAIKNDFVVVCDTTINTEIIEAQRGLIGIFEWTPVRSIEKIKVISVINDLKVQVSFA